MVAANRDLNPDTAAVRARWERFVRAWVEREYARQSITPVEYDLQVL
jgi:hypothetical protein